ncbi:hypothetical protein HK103_003770 [Boothiomyces macroporosus]|uniref:Integral membrane protein n=1 Tax=Boothiomyces macroporosus TaxID=261099 RepID=A0AAD5ULU4_9FUNG|nr:hypothetical protein HK103_003770 [Boothiomyces macroporosus]
MFIGEIMCLFVFEFMKWRKSKNEYQPVAEVEDQPENQETIYDEIDAKAELTGWKQVLFLIPTLCDLTATTLMNVGLIFVSASIYQMLRGSVVLFTGIFSTLFLGRKHPAYRWAALFVVFLGVAIVGLSSVFQASESAARPTSPIGVFLVVVAQGFTATQFVVEEKIMSKYSIEPLKAVGLEGFFGLFLTVAAVPILHFTLGVNGEPGNVFDMYEMYRQIMFPQVLWAGFGIMFSISIFNWCGLAVTQNISATSRSTIDTSRTMFIWMASLALGWESFKSLQVVGFIVLIYGTFLFNDVVSPPFCLKPSVHLEEVEPVADN